MESTAGLIAATVAAPFIYTVDKAVVEKSSNNKKIMVSVVETLRGIRSGPLRFVMDRKFLWILAVYGPTYIAANIIDRLCTEY